MSTTGLDVRELGLRWASCSPRGKLAFHWKCMLAPPTIIDYIVVHELCHARHRDHTNAFWNEVDKVMPATENARSGFCYPSPLVTQVRHF